MDQQVTTTNAAAVFEQVLIKGDLSKLTPQERTKYYMEVCRSIGLNPLTKPFEYILLNNKLTLYALRTCTDQLRSIHGVSVEDLSESERDGVYIVTAKVRNKEGRTDMAKGAVTLGQLKGEALANAIMKCETKAKRRATLSICGLGFLDETEVESLPPASPAPEPVVEAKAENTDPYPTLDEQNGTKWLKNLDVLLAQASETQHVVDLRGDSRVEKAIKAAPTAIRMRIEDMFKESYARLGEPDYVDAEPV
jgi:hypothetical protein